MRSWWTSWERYQCERERDERTFARDHSYNEWVRQQLWEAGER